MHAALSWSPLLQQELLLLLLLLLQQLLPLLLRCGVSGCLCDNSLSLSQEGRRRRGSRLRDHSTGTNFIRLAS